MKVPLTNQALQLVAVGILLLFGLNYSSTKILFAQDSLRVGVWNIEKLSTSATRGFPELRGSDSLPPRTDSALEQIATYIRDELNVDALMVTEIDADSPLSTAIRPQSEQLNRIALQMGENWKYFLGRTGDDMRLGLLFNTDRVRLKKLVNLQAPEFPVSGKDILDRDPFIVWISAIDQGELKNDLILICVHLKSQQKPYKDNRMAAVAKLIGDITDPEVRDELTLPSKREEPEVIILGDCNDSSFKDSGFKYMFDYLEGVGFRHVRNGSSEYPHTRVNGSQIDHLFASKKIFDETMISGSFKVHSVEDAERNRYRRIFSDHFPLTLDLRVSSDNDFTLQEAFATIDPEVRRQRMDILQDEAFARAVRQTTGRVEEESDTPLLIQAEIRDDHFEEILAPSRAVYDREIRTTPAPADAPRASMHLGRDQARLRTSDLDNNGVEFNQSVTSSRIAADRFAKSDSPIVFLEQNWSASEAVEFYSLRQGSPIMRRDFFNALEQPDNRDLFRDSDYLARFGFLPRRPHVGNPEGYPIGFTGDSAIELNCSACHTSKLTYSGKEYWIDGSQARTDLDTWLHELVRAIKLTVQDAPNLSQFPANQTIVLDQETKFGRFVRRLTGGTAPSVAQAQVILGLLEKELNRRQRYNDYNDFGRFFTDDAHRMRAQAHPSYGFGRLDALGAILNQACAEMIQIAENAEAADAPVNYPAIWDAPQHTHVQWNGAVDNTATFGPLGRNAGQVIGVFGLVDIEESITGYKSSINFDALERAEELITKLWSPAWPAEFGLDHALASSGEAIYRANCIQCHALIDRRDPERLVHEVLVPLDQRFGPQATLGTDHRTAQNWNDRRARIGPLAGRNESLPFRGTFPDDPATTVPARSILSHLVFNTIVHSFVPWSDELTIEDAHQRTRLYVGARTTQTLMRYKARPLNGVWSTAPYLHNGSILNIVQLLTPPDSRQASFRVGTTEFDPDTLGYRNEGSFTFDTTLPGNSNQGHQYGTELTPEEKTALIEYLKTL